MDNQVVLSNVVAWGFWTVKEDGDSEHMRLFGGPFRRGCAPAVWLELSDLPESTYNQV